MRDLLIGYSVHSAWPIRISLLHEVNAVDRDSITSAVLIKTTHARAVDDEARRILWFIIE